ncbi:hypothetical protein OS965_41045 [Streptomyces sp. H27-G5]|nr:hypothetical protein [Streptomyces sp. H27-G5]MCY0924403.1 hypothetical protein [Streptomyces sp. H27-G5]
MPGSLEEWPGLADDVADGGPTDVPESIGKDVHRAQSALVDKGQHDAFLVADLLREDATAGAWLAFVAAPLVGEPLGLGCLPRLDASNEIVQLRTGHGG